MNIDFSNPLAQQMTPDQAFALLQQWHTEQAELAKIKAREIGNRKTLAEFYFRGAGKGTHKLPMGQTHELVLVQSETIDLDEALVHSMGKMLYEQGVPMDLLIKWKPTLDKRQYNSLNEAQRKLFDQLVTTTLGTPSLKIQEIGTPDEEPQPAATVTIQASGAGMSVQGQLEPALPPTIDDPEQAAPGDWLIDDEGSWWHMLADGEWQEVGGQQQVREYLMGGPAVEPEPEKPKRGRKAAAKKTTTKKVK